jgi:chromosome condensin MukBEF MukE localization factor
MKTFELPNKLFNQIIYFIYIDSNKLTDDIINNTSEQINEINKSIDNKKTLHWIIDCSNTIEVTKLGKIYMIYFFVNCLRLLSNFSYLCFSVSRFFLSTSLMKRFAKKFEKLNLKKFYFILFNKWKYFFYFPC